MTFLAPAGFLALAALALPLALHLWRRPPRTVLLGSLRFLQSHPRPWRDLRWRERTLLLARLGLLGALALLLARPVWQPTTAGRPVHWALLDPAAAPAGASLRRLQVLQSNGAETRLLAPGFPVVRTPPADPGAGAPDLWSLLREADAGLPPGSTLAVVSPGLLASLRGLRPALAHARVEWINTASAPVAARATAPRPPVRPLAVVVLHDADRAEDARWLTAALRAVSQTGSRPLDISAAAISSPVPAADWIFWLGAQPIPPDVARSGVNVFHDADTTDLPEAAPGWIVPQPGVGFTGMPVRLWRRLSAMFGSVFWTDGFGQPLLTRTGDARHAQWHFASRFHPAWNDLPLGTALPAALRTLLLADAAPVDPDSHVAADPAQCLPSDRAAVPAVQTAFPGAATDLRPALWWLAAGLFGLERIFSHRRTPRPAPLATPAAAQTILSR